MGGCVAFVAFAAVVAVVAFVAAAGWLAGCGVACVSVSSGAPPIPCYISVSRAVTRGYILVLQTVYPCCICKLMG